MIRERLARVNPKIKANPSDGKKNNRSPAMVPTGKSRLETGIKLARKTAEAKEMMGFRRKKTKKEITAADRIKAPSQTCGCEKSATGI